jgi:hypothetical protein
MSPKRENHLQAGVVFLLTAFLTADILFWRVKTRWINQPDVGVSTDIMGDVAPFWVALSTGMLSKGMPKSI